MADLSIQSVPANSDELPDMPIEPSWIEEGTPVARGTVLVQSADKLLSSGLWSCTAGKFRWEFGWDEFVHVLEGEVTITEEGG
ncbi:MAG: cupin domain-containing protein, partial [Planctomycetaceae bacterium]